MFKHIFVINTIKNKTTPNPTIPNLEIWRRVPAEFRNPCGRRKTWKPRATTHGIAAAMGATQPGPPQKLGSSRPTMSQPMRSHQPLEASQPEGSMVLFPAGIARRGPWSAKAPSLAPSSFGLRCRRPCGDRSKHDN